MFYDTMRLKHYMLPSRLILDFYIVKNDEFDFELNKLFKYELNPEVARLKGHINLHVYITQVFKSH